MKKEISAKSIIEEAIRRRPQETQKQKMSAPSTPTKRTAGEELWSVHLRRTNSPHHNHDEDEDDNDYDIPRKRSRSIGEELFLTHLKRSEGFLPDYDTDPSDDRKPSAASKKKSAPKQGSSSSSKKKSSIKTRATDIDDGIHLRDGRVVSHKAQ